MVLPLAVCTRALKWVREGVVVTDAARQILYVNQAFEVITGYEPEEVLGLTPAVLKSGRHDEAFYRALYVELAERGEWSGQIWNRQKNGEIYLQDMTLETVRDADGNLTHYIGVLIDDRFVCSPDKQIECLSAVDMLTQLPSTAVFLEQLKQKIEHASRYGGSVAVFLLNLDNFKLCNERHGHITADRVLAGVNQRLMQFVRVGNKFARIGGDEFAVLLTDLENQADLEAMARNLLEVIAAPYELEGQSLRQTASMGVSQYPGDAEDSDTMMLHAKQALFLAKQGSGGEFHLYDKALDQEARVRQNLLERLEQALRNQEFVLHYQPKVNLRTGRVVGVEALIRWQHPQEGLLYPGAFLPYIEHNDIIVDIGNWVICQALSQIAEWAQRGIHLTVSVNVAARQLQRGDFLNALRDCLHAHPDAPASQLELEILESAALENTRHVREIIDVCNEWGINFALDDFGTGYASLAYLRNIPADVLKIDQSFVRDLLDDSDDLTLVEGVIALATSFRRTVVAEGVETPEQGVLLMRLGCEIAQGYAIAKPMPSASVPDWIANYKHDPQWVMWADIPWEMEDFPLLVAQYDHIKWVKRILDFLEGANLQLTPGELSDHHQCRFGHWYYQYGQDRYGHMQAFRDIEPVHREVHLVGPEIIKLKQAGDMVQARIRAKQLLDLKDEVLHFLAALQRSVAGVPVDHHAYVERRSMTGESESIMTHPLDKRLGKPQRATILIVDDTPTNIELLAELLAVDYQVKFAVNGNKALELLATQEKPDLILLDVMMPGMDGYEVCRRLKDDPITRHIPVVFITARSDVADQERGFSVGGVDYITKPFEASLVKARIRNHISFKQRTDVLEAQASLDGLTGIPNRRRFDEVFNLEWRRAARNLKPISLLMLDVDQFKNFNDKYGHGAGDDCLRQVSNALRLSLSRPGDFIARYGGEEFVVVLPGCNLVGAQAVAEHIRSLVEALHVPHASSSAGPYVTVSVGCAMHKPAQGGEAVALLHAADAALYRAKEEGRNRVCIGHVGDSVPAMRNEGEA